MAEGTTADWIVLVILLSLIGVLAHEIVHGDHLFGARVQYSPDARAQDEAYRSGGTSNASELSKLSHLISFARTGARCSPLSAPPRSLVPRGCS